MNEKEKFARLLKEVKEALELNHNQFADLIGHPRDTYISWYNGINGCEEAKKERILEAIKKVLKDIIL